jgi:hypothetical protein
MLMPIKDHMVPIAKSATGSNAFHQHTITFNLLLTTKGNPGSQSDSASLITNATNDLQAIVSLVKSVMNVFDVNVMNDPFGTGVPNVELHCHDVDYAYNADKSFVFYTALLTLTVVTQW